MSKKGQVGADATWGGPHKATNLAKGNARKNMQVSKYPCDYKAGPISSIAKG